MKRMTAAMMKEGKKQVRSVYDIKHNIALGSM